MKTLKLIIRFFLVFVLSYVIILMVSYRFQNTYSQIFRSSLILIFESFGENGFVRAYPHHDGSGKKLDTKLVLFSKKQIQAAKQSGQKVIKGAEMYMSSWYTTFLPGFLLFCLVIATPISFHRKWKALLWGGVLLATFIVSKTYLSILYEYNQNSWLEVNLVNHTFLRKIMEIAYQFFVMNIETTIIVPVFIWILITFRKTDLSRIMSQQVVNE